VPNLTAGSLASNRSNIVGGATTYPRKVAGKAPAGAIGNAVEAAYRRGDLFDKRRRM
jgi:hypothetical protein